ncbi:hypothetical protein QWY31_08580 [Cytophagales bacterium LB-30]|uniref:Uncharacterized protein n=1 Tax=Shiella aurantiaca TaxID=3058365 RepID=A0ABT8F5K4_9BACT|nr:hypothetical protein [Shiella aurantiaca]MDN4165554.1 hypothetical protein [Shiella aurantiaca]
MNKVRVLFFFLSACLSQVYAQSQVPFADANTFEQDIDQLFLSAPKSADSLARYTFIGHWQSSTFSASQKDQILQIAAELHAKKQKAVPDYTNFFALVNSLIAKEGSAGVQCDSLLFSLHQTLLNNPIKEYHQMVLTSRLFLEKGMLYDSRYNRVYVTADRYRFRYLGFQTPVVEEVVEESEEISEEEDESWFDEWDQPADENESSWGNDDPWGTETASEETPVEEEVAAPAYFEPAALPSQSGALLALENATIWIVSPYDSVPIRQTEGSLQLSGYYWLGQGGTFDWRSAGISPDTLSVALDAYQFFVNKIEFSAEGVSLSHKVRLEEPVKGVMEFKSMARKSDAENTYPRFKSYTNDIRLLGLGDPHLIYKGGFALSGAKVYSSSLQIGRSSLELQDAAVPKFFARSHRFTLGDSVITAQKASIVLYHREDSIYHPSVQFEYNTSTRLLTLLEEQGPFRNTPFIAPFYGMEFTADLVKWYVDSTTLDFSILEARNRVPITFESLDYYDEVKFNRLSGIYPFHPLMLVVSYARKMRKEEIYISELADYSKVNADILKGAMNGLLQEGFIQYDNLTGRIVPNPKAYHYIDSFKKRKDYDNISLDSRTPGKANVSMDLRSQEMLVRGVKRFDISKALNVYVEPINKEVKILQNRGIVFDGTVFAGNYKYIGKDFRFDYDSFLINLNQIDSLKFNIATDKRDKNNQQVKRQLDNQLVETAGVLYINEPDNKSAQRELGQYPLFKANKGATVYFIGKEVLGGAYDNSLYFEIPPFEIDSVSASDPNTIGFEGVFHSGGVFPEFNEILKVMPDGALGFEHKLPEEGFELYGRDSRFYGDLRLDNGGLHGKDRIEHLSTTLYSNDFVFFMDSVSARGTLAEMRAGTLNGTSYPNMTAKNYKMKWLPRKDSLYMSTIREPFEFYENTATFRGISVVSSKGVYAAGLLETRGSEARSRGFTFREKDFRGRHANFVIKSSNPEKPALAATDVKLNFDLENNKADVSPEREGVAAINFPYAQYKTSISKAVWDLNDKTVSMTKPASVPLSKSYFYTTRPDFDSLVFNATGAKYDINELKLNIYGIPFIKVADAKITPKNNEVLILENAALQKLEDAKLEIDTLNGYHRLVKGSIDILSRKKFEGDATYQFVSVLKDTTDIKFGEFRLESSTDSRGKQLAMHTVASGEVYDVNNLLISPGMYFKGMVTMRADKKALELDGFVKLDLKSRPGYDTWIAYKSDAEQQEIVFDFNNSYTERGERLIAGVHFESGTNSLYSTFASDKRTPADMDFFKPNGQLSYDAQKNEFKIETASKEAGETFSGTLYAYNDNTGEIRMEGPFRFLEGTPKALSMKAAGKGTGNLETNDFSFNALLMFQFGLPSLITDAIGLDMLEVVEMLGAPEANNNLNDVLDRLASVVNENAAKAYEERALNDYTPLNSMSNELMKSLVFSSVDLKWSETEKAWYSTGKLGLSNITRNDINASLDGFMEIRKNLSGESVHIFMQLSPSSWYYFGYEEGRMLLFTSNAEVNDIIAKKSNAAKAKVGEFVYVDGDMETTLNFINRFRKTYFDIDVPYTLDMPQVPSEDDMGLGDPGILPSTDTETDTEDEDDGF